ncbi:MAG: DUF4124 domain-containing protein [Nitrosomonas sp.]|nr:DUF4124 domain-containing protein [Nitrosomonas sp.]
MKKIMFVAIFYFSYASADTIYQWSDPWGQIQYSKTPVPGAMISDLTALPAPQETTEQQKQEAMLRKFQSMRQDNLRFSQAEAERQVLRMQELEARAQCEQLRDLMFEVQVADFRRSSIYGFYLLPGYYGHLQMDISREIRQKCR